MRAIARRVQADAGVEVQPELITVALMAARAYWVRGETKTAVCLAQEGAGGPAGSNVLGLLQNVGTHIKDFGGHKGAADVSFERRHLDGFRDALNVSAEHALESGTPATPFDVDATAALPELLDTVLTPWREVNTMARASRAIRSWKP